MNRKQTFEALIEHTRQMCVAAEQGYWERVQELSSAREVLFDGLRGQLDAAPPPVDELVELKALDDTLLRSARRARDEAAERSSRQRRVRRGVNAYHGAPVR